MSSRTAGVFRIAAVAEALSWAGLLIGMFFKYIVGIGDGGVPVLGMVHGVVFTAYVVTTLAVFRPLRWSPATLLIGLLSSVPPLFTWLFEKWALRTGKLDGPGRITQGGTALFRDNAVGA